MTKAVTGVPRNRNARTRKQWAALICAAWQSSIEGIFATGRRLKEAQGEIAEGEWCEMVERDLPFNRKTAHKLITIAADARLTDVSHGRHLPPHWSTLYQLTKLSDEVLAEKLGDGTINAETERADVQLLINRITRSERFAEMSAPPLPTDERVPVLYADPPWQFEVWRESSAYGAALEHYPCMALDDICALPMGDCATPDAVLFLWTTAPMLREAFTVLDAWGFTYKTNMVWDKEVQGMGYWVRNQHETLMIATRGDFPTPDPACKPASVISWRRAEHSRKPPVVYEHIERMYPGLAKREIFARQRRIGWAEPWGNQALAMEESAA